VVWVVGDATMFQFLIGTLQTEPQGSER